MNTSATLITTGRVTADFTLQSSQNGNNTPYVQFSLAVNKGYGDKEHPNFYQCVLYNEAAQRIVNAKVKKGSLIHIVGDLDLVEFTRNDGTKGISPKVTVFDWSYLPANRSSNDSEQPAGNTHQNPNNYPNNTLPQTGYPSNGYPPAGNQPGRNTSNGYPPNNNNGSYPNRGYQYPPMDCGQNGLPR